MTFPTDITHPTVTFLLNLVDVDRRLFDPGLNACEWAFNPSGLWHHQQFNGQPLKKTVDRMPGPSWIAYLFMSNIIPVIYFTLLQISGLRATVKLLLIGKIRSILRATKKYVGTLLFYPHNKL
jgi:hypothetical protein